MIKVFVTIGSWKFDQLIKHVDRLLSRDKFEVVIQFGNGSYEPRNHESFRLAPSIKEYIANADIIISHGGTGSLLEVLNMGKPLIAVPNPNVMDNHQYEFVHFLEQQGMLACVDVVENLAEEDLVRELNKENKLQDLSILYKDVIDSLNFFLRTGKVIT